MEAKAEELDGIRYWDGRAIDLEGGKGNLGFLFFEYDDF
mgnify:CR=1 FL=1